MLIYDCRTLLFHYFSHRRKPMVGLASLTKGKVYQRLGIPKVRYTKGKAGEARSDDVFFYAILIS